MSLHPTTPEYMERLMGEAMNLVDRVEDLAEQFLLLRCAELSRKFPDRIITVVGGNGGLFVDISPKQTHNAVNWSYYSFSGEHRYQLCHGGDIDAPEFMQETRDWLFGWMEEAEDNSLNIYSHRPMVACGIINFLNGERL